MPKVSVIIPVYNVEKYLESCLNSVLAQTFQDWEAICINDGSPDQSDKILAQFAAKDGRFKMITQENQGLSMARNAGLEAATGDWITFLDSDDILPPYALETFHNIAVNSNVEVVASRGRLSAGQNYMSTHKNVRIKHGLKDFVTDRNIFSSACNKLFDAKLFRTLRFPKGMMYEDWPTMTILFGNVNTYATTDIPCYAYREDNQSITRSLFTSQKVESYIKGVRMVAQFYYNTPKFIYARKRMAVAIKMLTNKVFHAQQHDLDVLTLNEIEKLFKDKILSRKDLSVKTRYRLWKIKHRIKREIKNA